MTELTTKWKELFPDVDISVFTGENSRVEKNETFKKYEIFEGVKIHRVSNFGKHHGILFDRVLFSIGFIFKAFFFLIRRRRNYDVLLITTNPPFLGILILLFKYLLDIPYIVIAYDIYPQILEKMGILKKTNPIYNFWRILNIRVYNNASKIISIGEDMTKVITNEMKVIDKMKIELIHNWSDKSKVFPVPKLKNNFIFDNNIENKKILLYSGTLGTTHNIEEILSAANELKLNRDILFLFIGSGAKVHLVNEYIANSGNDNVKLLPFQPIEVLSETLSCASLSFVCLDSKFTGMSVPSKSYGILASKVPIIGLMSSDAEISRMIEKHNCGIVWNQESKEKLSKKIIDLLSNDILLKTMRDNAYNLFLNNYNIDISVKKYHAIVKSVLD